MEWWAWLLIWAGLVLALIATLVILGIRLFRKAIAVLEALGDLGEKLAQIGENVDELTPDPPKNAILRGYPLVADERDGIRERRLARKSERRQAAIVRGKLLTTTLPTRRT